MTADSGDGGERLAPVTYLPGARAAEAGWAVPGVDEAPPERPPVAERQAKRAANVSLAGLGRRNMSRWEVENLLRSRDLDDETIDYEIGRLEAVGLVDDRALAETLVRTQHERKGLGRQGIIAELRRRHIEQEIIDGALEALDQDDERERALELAEKRASQLQSYDHDTAKRRLTGFLQRKGYSSEVIRDAVDHALSSHRPRPGGVRFR